MEKIALVTGANRGIGYEVCRQLKEKGFTVILTARNKREGYDASNDLGVDFHQLDVTKEKDIEDVYNYVKNRYKRIDVLVNNAGISIDDNKPAVDVDKETVQLTFHTNTLGPLVLSQKFFDLMKDQDEGRIINVSSGMGQLNSMGGGNLSYRVSKAALNAVTRILADELKEHSIHVNSVCPGWVRTDMGGSNAHRPLEKGAETIVWLATSEDIGTGKFYRDKKEIEW